ncbi:MAG TPA: hypothetical protein IAB14_05420 [Candidatus Stercoripulliclostridium merdipullorum]|uniref:2Fe-2S iron-sulfur cluster binding domain-containing protein n=1 Tax=Candidatus Stercoripulliclostridium merdipullorum TaxID=2840952 RepID=A0A9D1SXU2_9FIRM|nr:hypothetical protein [Candidatus Stercoripulliclostridium merdipullorum]
MKLILKTQQPESLRDRLIAEGFRFPCGGKGVCGRCRIVAPALPVTALDRRFLTDDEMTRGVRLACDKTFDKELHLECMLDRATPERKLDDPEVIVFLGSRTAEISLTDGDIVDSVVVEYGDCTTREIRAAIDKEAIEMFERYHCAKANVMMVAGGWREIEAFAAGSDVEGGGRYEAARFSMPAEEVYLPPVKGGAGSGDLLEIADREDGTLTVIADGTLRFWYRGDSILTAEIPFKPDDPYGARVIKATLRYFAEEVIPTTFIGSENDYVRFTGAVGFVPKGSSLARDKALAAMQSNRVKTALDRLYRRVETVDLVNEDRWQQLLASG